MKKKIFSGIMVTMFLVTMVAFAVPVRVSAYTGAPIKFGLVGPIGWITWDGIKEGAQLAAELINDAGGIKDKMGGPGYLTHEVKLVEIDEHVVPVPDPTAAVAEMLAALEDNPEMQFLVGGFRTECVLPLKEAVMDFAAAQTPHRPIWFVCGASEDYIIDCGGGTPDWVTGEIRPYCGACARCDYERYKYMFRVTPINSTSLGTQLAALMAQYIVPKLKAIFGMDPLNPADRLPAYLVAEDLMWCRAIVARFLNPASQARMGIDFTGRVARPSAIETDFSPILDAIEASGAKIVVHVFAAVAGATFIKQWGERKLAAVPVGINVESQMAQFWAETGGKCNYETIMGQAGTKTLIIPGAEPLDSVEIWDKYLAKFGHTPIYTAWGSYGAIMTLNLSAQYYDWIGKDCEWIISNVLEEEPRQPGATGWFKYTPTHDVWQDPSYSMTSVWPSRDMTGYDPNVQPYTRALLPQWQAGRLEIVWPRGHWRVVIEPEPLTFARKWKVPPWVYSLGETDFAGGPGLPSPPEWLKPGMGGYFGNFMLPDNTVGTHDMGAVTDNWQQTCPWTVLEADMDGNNYIDIDDVARVALDWGKTVIPE